MQIRSKCFVKINTTKNSIINIINIDVMMINFLLYLIPLINN